MLHDEKWYFWYIYSFNLYLKPVAMRQESKKYLSIQAIWSIMDFIFIKYTFNNVPKKRSSYVCKTKKFFITVYTVKTLGAILVNVYVVAFE